MAEKELEQMSIAPDAAREVPGVSNTPEAPREDLAHMSDEQYAEELGNEIVAAYADSVASEGSGSSIPREKDLELTRLTQGSSDRFEEARLDTYSLEASPETQRAVTEAGQQLELYQESLTILNETAARMEGVAKERIEQYSKLVAALNDGIASSETQEEGRSSLKFNTVETIQASSELGFEDLRDLAVANKREISRATLHKLAGIAVYQASEDLTNEDLRAVMRENAVAMYETGSQLQETARRGRESIIANAAARVTNEATDAYAAKVANFLPEVSKYESNKREQIALRLGDSLPEKIPFASEDTQVLELDDGGDFFSGEEFGDVLSLDDLEAAYNDLPSNNRTVEARPSRNEVKSGGQELDVRRYESLLERVANDPELAFDTEFPGSTFSQLESQHASDILHAFKGSPTEEEVKELLRDMSRTGPEGQTRAFLAQITSYAFLLQREEKSGVSRSEITKWQDFKAQNGIGSGGWKN